MKIFNDKIVFVTGGSRGIGKTIALEFASLGADIAFNYFRRDKQALETQNEIEKKGVRCLKIRSNLSDTTKVKGMFQEINNYYGKLDILINNAASGVQKSAAELEEKHWDWTMNINAKAPWICSIEASKLMSSGGSIVNITSEGSRHVLPYYFSVGTSKAALESLTRYLAVELSQKNISVNAVSGGYIETDALDSFPNKDSMLESSQKTLIDRSVSKKDVADAVVFLCSEKGNAIRGQVIVVDGGASLKVL
ncbi:MAG: enoyl-[acyl-carrier-protein] reductase FabL [SAR202 cluster bacterium]|nr:enoyl-[acyl-carrier-protein] reductase FabL [SAR202 cluster bacterium]|tara:strand:+ start:62405 stop:63157 length:753 start_codon:yes stop_codon:yes gene_type:complete